MAELDLVDIFEQRLADIEKIVFGDVEKDADYPKGEKLKASCTESLVDVHNKIQSGLTGKKKAALIFKKLPELKQYLDHSIVDEMMLTSQAVADSIIAEAEFIRRQVVLLEKLKNNQEHMNSEHIQGAAQQAGKLQTLSKLHITQQDQVSRLTEETRRILESYNTIVSLLSKQFIVWDQTLTLLETRSKK